MPPLPLELEPAARAARSEARSWPAASGRLQMKRRPSGAVIGMVRTPGTWQSGQVRMMKMSVTRKISRKETTQKWNEKLLTHCKGTRTMWFVH